MGSGCSNVELTCRAKKFRERKRREKTQLKRLIALGVPEAMARKLDNKQVRRMLSRPLEVKKRYPAQAASGS